MLHCGVGEYHESVTGTLQELLKVWVLCKEFEYIPDKIMHIIDLMWRSSEPYLVASLSLFLQWLCVVS